MFSQMADVRISPVIVDMVRAILQLLCPTPSSIAGLQSPSPHTWACRPSTVPSGVGFPSLVMVPPLTPPPQLRWGLQFSSLLWVGHSMACCCCFCWIASLPCALSMCPRFLQYLHCSFRNLQFWGSCWPSQR